MPLIHAAPNPTRPSAKHAPSGGLGRNHDSPAGVVDNVLDNTPDVAVLLGKVVGPQLGRGLVVVGVSPENTTRLPLGTDDSLRSSAPVQANTLLRRSARLLATGCCSPIPGNPCSPSCFPPIDNSNTIFAFPSDKFFPPRTANSQQPTARLPACASCERVITDVHPSLQGCFLKDKRSARKHETQLVGGAGAQSQSESECETRCPARRSHTAAPAAAPAQPLVRRDVTAEANPDSPERG